MKDLHLKKLLTFLQRLDETKTHYALWNYREDAISVEVYIPGEHWEVDFLEDGTIEVERYRSNGRIEGESVLEELFVGEPATDGNAESVATQDDPARK